MQTIDEIISGIFENQKALGWSNQQLADAADMSRTTLERLKRGETQAPSAQNIFALAAAVGYQIGETEIPPEDGITQTIRTYEDRIARQRAFYNMLLAEKNRILSYCAKAIGALILINFLAFLLLAVLLFVVIIHAA